MYVAAGGPMVARYAGRVADGFICTSGKGVELYADQLVPAVDEGLDKAGRDRDEIDRMIEIKLSWDPDPELALENTRFWAPLSLTPSRSTRSTAPPRWSGPPTSCRSSRWRSGGWWPRAPRRSSRRCGSTPTSGFDHLVVHGPGHDQERFLSTFAEQVLPGLRELTPAAR